MKKKYLLFTLLVLFFSSIVFAEELNSGFAKINSIEYPGATFGGNVYIGIHKYNDGYVTIAPDEDNGFSLVVFDNEGKSIVSYPIEDYSNNYTVIGDEAFIATENSKIIKVSLKTGEKIKEVSEYAKVYPLGNSLIIYDYDDSEIYKYDTDLNDKTSSDLDNEFNSYDDYYVDNLIVSDNAVYAFVKAYENYNDPRPTFHLCTLNNNLETEKCNQLGIGNEIIYADLYFRAGAVYNDNIYGLNDNVYDLSGNEIEIFKECFCPGPEVTSPRPTLQSPAPKLCKKYQASSISMGYLLLGGVLVDYDNHTRTGFVEIYDKDLDLIDTIEYPDTSAVTYLQGIDNGFLVKVLGTTPSSDPDDFGFEPYYDFDDSNTKGIIDEYQMQYKIKAEVKEGKGTIDVKKFAFGNEVIEVTVKPEDGYTLGSVKVTDANGKTVEYKGNTFVMPSADVTIEAKFVLAAINPDTRAGITLLIVILISSAIAFVISKKKQLNQEE